MRRALVVEDEPAVRQLIVRSLVREDFRCEQASDGSQARQFLESGVYDVVVTDLRMPGEHGYALTQRILACQPRPLVVVLTAVADGRIVRQLMRDGVDDVMFKPIDFSAFAAKVKTLVDRQLSRRDKDPPSGVMSRASEPVADAPELSDRQSVPETSSASMTAADPANVLGDTADGACVGSCGGVGGDVGYRPSTSVPTARRQLPAGLAPRMVAAVMAAVLFALILPYIGRSVVNARRAGDARPHTLATTPTSAGVEVVVAGPGWSGLLPALKRTGQKLSLRAPGFTDKEMKRLPQLKHLYELDLSNSSVTDAGLAQVAELSGLRRLKLSKTAISSRGLDAVRSLENLEVLDLSHTAIDDEALKKVTWMPKLRIVDLSGNNLSTPAVQRFRRQRPQVQVVE